MAERRRQNIDAEYANRVRAAVRIMQQAGLTNYTADQFYKEAIAAKLRIVADEFNGGRPIPADEEPLRRGKRPTTN